MRLLGSLETAARTINFTANAAKRLVTEPLLCFNVTLSQLGRLAPEVV